MYDVHRRVPCRNVVEIYDNHGRVAPLASLILECKRTTRRRNSWCRNLDVSFSNLSISGPALHAALPAATLRLLAPLTFGVH